MGGEETLLAAISRNVCCFLFQVMTRSPKAQYKHALCGVEKFRILGVEASTHLFNDLNPHLTRLSKRVRARRQHQFSRATWARGSLTSPIFLLHVDERLLNEAIFILFPVALEISENRKVFLYFKTQRTPTGGYWSLFVQCGQELISLFR